MCADRASGLLCGEFDDASGLRVCPKGAGDVYEDSSGWVAALVMLCIVLFINAVTAFYMAAVRGAVRWPDGTLLLGGRTPLEDLALAFTVAHFPKSKTAIRYREAEAAKARAVPVGANASPPSAGNAAARGGGRGGGGSGEPPEMVLLTPDAVDRYRRYLLQRYRETGDEPSPFALNATASDDRPGGRPKSLGDGGATPLTPRGASEAGSRSNRINGGGGFGATSSPSYLGTPLDRELQRELSALQRENTADQELLAMRALEVDAVDREVDAHRSRLARLLELEREKLVRELAVGPAAAREPLPTETLVTAAGVAPGYREENLGSGRFALSHRERGGDRHGGFGGGSAPHSYSPPENDFTRPQQHGVHEQVSSSHTNPIAQLFQRLDAHAAVGSANPAVRGFASRTPRPPFSASSSSPVVVTRATGADELAFDGRPPSFYTGRRAEGTKEYDDDDQHRRAQRDDEGAGAVVGEGGSSPSPRQHPLLGFGRAAPSERDL